MKRPLYQSQLTWHRIDRLYRKYPFDGLALAVIQESIDQTLHFYFKFKQLLKDSHYNIEHLDDPKMGSDLKVFYEFVLFFAAGVTDTVNGYASPDITKRFNKIFHPILLSRVAQRLEKARYFNSDEHKVLTLDKLNKLSEEYLHDKALETNKANYNLLVDNLLEDVNVSDYKLKWNVTQADLKWWETQTDQHWRGGIGSNKREQLLLNWHPDLNVRSNSKRSGMTYWTKRPLETIQANGMGDQ